MGGSTEKQSSKISEKFVYTWESMSLVQIGVRWVHLSASILLAALFLFELVVVAPFARKPPETIQSLFLSRQIRDLGLAAVVVRRFSTSSLIAVAAMALTGLSNSVFMVGSFHGLLTTDYGHLLLSKLVLFHLLVGFGAWNLLLLKPRLAVDVPAMNVVDQERTIRSLFRNVLWEIGLGGAVILIVALLGTTSPPLH